MNECERERKRKQEKKKREREKTLCVCAVLGTIFPAHASLFFHSPPNPLSEMQQPREAGFAWLFLCHTY